MSNVQFIIVVMTLVLTITFVIQEVLHRILNV